MTNDPHVRRLLQFRLSTLFMVVLVLSLPLSWIAVRMEKSRHQRRALKALEKEGCRITFDNEWMPRALCVAAYVVASDSSVTNADMRNFQDLHGLEGIELDNTAISDAGLEHLRGLTSLRALSLDNTRVTDHGLANLRGLRNLVALSIEGTLVTDGGIEHLSRLSQLEMLISNAAISQAGTQELKCSLPNCKIWALTDKGRVRVDKQFSQRIYEAGSNSGHQTK